MIDVPKFLILQSDSDSMYDERVVGLIKHTLPAQQPLPALFQDPHTIHLMDYSNKYGIMIHCLDNDIGIKNLNTLNQQFSKGEQQTHKLNFNFEGDPYIVSFSSDEEYLAVVTNTQIHIIKTSELKQSKVEYSTQTAQPVTNLIWVGNNGVLYWKFDGKPYHYSLDKRSVDQFPECDNCSCVQQLNNHFVVASTEQSEQCSEWVLKIYSREFKHVGSIKYPQQAYVDSQCYYFNSADVVSISKLNNLTSQEFQTSDIYSFITVYYQKDIEDYDLISGKNIFFAQGDLSTANVKFKGGFLLYTHRNQRDQYMGKLEAAEFKRSFAVKSCLQTKLNLFVSSVERSEAIYVVDLQSEFQDMRLADFPGKYEFKSGSTLVGFSIMKNMMELEENYKGSNKDMNLIVKQFAGKLLNIGIKEKDKDMVVPFPVSILAYNCKGIQIRQYLVITKPNADTQDQQAVKLKQMGQIVDKCPIVQSLPLFQQETYIKTRKPILYKPILNETRSIQKSLEQQKLTSHGDLVIPPKTDNQMDSASSLFGTNTNVFNNPNTMTGVNSAASGFLQPKSTQSDIVPLGVEKSSNIFDKTSNTPKNLTEGNTLNLNVPNIIIPGIRPSGAIDINPLVNKDKPLLDTNTGIGNSKISSVSPVVSNLPLTGMSVMPGQKRADNNQKGSFADNSRNSQDNVQRCCKILVQKNKDVQSFLKYFNEPLKQYFSDRQFQKASSIKEYMTSILSNLKREEQAIQMNTSQIEVSEGNRQRSNFSFSQSDPRKAEDLVQDKLKEFQAITNRLSYLKNKFSTQRQSLNILKPLNLDEVVAKAIQLQTNKVDQLVRKSSRILEKFRDQQMDNRQALNNKYHGRYVFPNSEFDFQEQDGGSTKGDIADLLSGFQPRVVKVESKPVFNLKEKQKEKPKQKEKLVRDSKQSKGQVRMASKRIWSFPTVIDQSEEEESKLDSQEQEDLAFKEIPSFKGQISDIEGRISQSSLQLGPKKQKEIGIVTGVTQVKKQKVMFNDSKTLEAKRQETLGMNALSKELEGIGILQSTFPGKSKVDQKLQGGLQKQKKQSNSLGFKLDFTGKQKEEPKQESGTIGPEVQTKPVGLFGLMSPNVAISKPSSSLFDNNKPTSSEVKDVETAIIPKHSQQQPPKYSIFGNLKPNTGNDINKTNIFSNKGESNPVPNAVMPPQFKSDTTTSIPSIPNNPVGNQTQSLKQTSMPGSNTRVVPSFNPQPNSSTLSLPQFGKSMFGASLSSNQTNPVVSGLPTSTNIFGQSDQPGKGQSQRLVNLAQVAPTTNIFSSSPTPPTNWPNSGGVVSNPATKNVNNQNAPSSQMPNQQQSGNFLGLSTNLNSMMGQNPNQTQNSMFSQQPQQPQSQPSWGSSQQNQSAGSLAGGIFKPRK